MKKSCVIQRPEHVGLFIVCCSASLAPCTHPPPPNSAVCPPNSAVSEACTWGFAWQNDRPPGCLQPQGSEAFCPGSRLPGGGRCAVRCGCPQAASACQAGHTQPLAPPESQQTRFSKRGSHRKAERCQQIARSPLRPSSATLWTVLFHVRFYTVLIKAPSPSSKPGPYPRPLYS